MFELAFLIAAFTTSLGEDPKVVHLLGGSPGAAGVPQLEIEGVPAVGRAFGLRVSDGAPGAVGAAALSVVEQTLALPTFGATVHVSEPFFLFTPFTLDADGRSPVLVSTPSLEPFLVGATFVAQALVFDAVAAGGVAFTSGRRITIGFEYTGAPFPIEIIPTGRLVQEIVAADFDGDGREDVVVSHLNDDTIGVHINRGDGTLAPVIVTPLAHTPSRLLAEDFDEDGLVDVIVSQSEIGQPFLLRGRGDGTFETPEQLSIGGFVTDFAAGDFDADGHLDLAATNGLPESVSVALGDGHGGYGLPFAFPTSSPPSDLALADLDGDGHLDAVTLDVSPARIALHFGNGDGTLDAPVTLTPPTSTGYIVLDDFDLDGFVDIAYGGGTNVSVWRGLGGGQFSARNDIPVGTMQRIVSRDVSGDGFPDLIAPYSNSSINGVGVALGLGDATFAPVTGHVLVDSPKGIATLHLDDDGHLDIVCGTGTSGIGALSNFLCVLRGVGGGALRDSLRTPTLEGVWAVDIGDIDNDDLLDVVVMSQTTHSIGWHRGLGGGALSAIQAVGPTGFLRDVALADMDSDGTLDLVAVDWVVDVLAISFGVGDGSFSPPVTAAVGEAPLLVETVDLDGDGLLDLVTLNRDSDDASIVLGLPGRAFGPETRLVLGAASDGLVVDDFDGDGTPDLAVSRRNLDVVEIRRGLGDGTFSAPTSWPTPSDPENLSSGDLDGDGDRDIVLEYSVGSAVLDNAGAGVFSSFQLLTFSWSATPPVCGDVDGDGVDDVIGSTGVGITSTYSGWTWIARRDGPGPFDASRMTVADRRPYAIAAGDLDGDGDLDLVTSDSEYDRLTVQLGTLVP